MLLKQERERAEKIQKEFEQKIKDLESHKLKLEKEQLRDIEAFKSEFLRSLKD